MKWVLVLDSPVYFFLSPPLLNCQPPLSLHFDICVTVYADRALLLHCALLSFEVVSGGHFSGGIVGSSDGANS